VVAVAVKKPQALILPLVQAAQAAVVQVVPLHLQIQQQQAQPTQVAAAVQPVIHQQAARHLTARTVDRE
jgi:hypothetical protein